MLRKPLLTLIFLLTAAAAYSQDTSYYYVRYNTDTNTLYNFNTIFSNGSEQLSMGSNDQLSNVVNLPFKWNFFGKEVTQYKISDNGYITFDVNASASEYGNTALPDNMFAPTNAIFAYWDDLWTHSFSDGQYASNVKTYTWGNSPNRVHVIQWGQVAPKGVTPSSANGGWMNFAIRIYEAGGFDIIHNTNNLAGAVGNLSATIGAQNEDGTKAVQVNGSPNIQNPGAYVYRFFANATQASYDVETTALTAPNYVDIITGTKVSITVHNLGKTAITSADLNIDIDGKVTTTKLTGLNLEANGGYNTITQTWIPTTGGKNVVYTAWLSNLNGSNADANTANDKMSKTIYISNKLSSRRVLIEEQTSATCGPCAALNPGLHEVLQENIDKIAVVKYQVYWPAPGNDPMYLQNPNDVKTRVNYYAPPSGQVSAPFTFIDGASAGDPRVITSELIDNFSARPAPFNIKADVKRSGNDYTFTVNLTSNVNTSTDDKLVAHIAVVENHIHFDAPASTNGEMDFYNVMRKMLPSASGTSLTAMTEGGTKQIVQTWSMNPSAYKAEELRLVVWVQSNKNREVYNAYWTAPGMSTGIEQPKNSIITGLYPNPANSITNMEFNLDKTTHVEANLMDMTGRQVKNITSGQMQAGAHSLPIDVSTLSKGVYYVSMTANGTVYTQKLVVQ